MNKKLYPPSPICAECGGRCCQAYPGICWPEDLGDNIRASIKTRLASGLYTIDWWEGDPREYDWDHPDAVSEGYFLRPAMKDHEGKLRHPAWMRGTCTFLRAGGCALPYNSRPYQCRALEPKSPGGRCKPHGGERQAGALAWLPYRAAIISVLEELSAREKSEKV